MGYEVGEVAQRLFPEGILIGDDDDLSAALVAKINYFEPSVQQAAE